VTAGMLPGASLAWGTLAALGVGLLQGGLHCSAMCGPFVLAFGLSTRPGTEPAGTWSTRVRSLAPLHLAHNAGRVTAFALLGAVFGAVGAFVDAAGALTGVQALAGLVGGAAMVLWALEEARSGHAGGGLERWSLLQLGPLRRRLPRLLARRDPAGAFLAGGLLGLHPCGLLYAMLLPAAATASWWRGGLLLLAFGLGTVPALLGVAAVGVFGGARVRGRAFGYAAGSSSPCGAWR
jgi:sulfite exporter TauE/SafE